jgi:hypothetical protein
MPNTTNYKSCGAVVLSPLSPHEVVKDADHKAMLLGCTRIWLPSCLIEADSFCQPAHGFRPVADSEPYCQKSANFAQIMPKYPSTAPIRLASATPSSGQRHKADKFKEAITPNDMRPNALDLIFKSDSGSKAHIPPSRNPKQRKEPIPSNACRHDMSVHGAAYDRAAIALIPAKKPLG